MAYMSRKHKKHKGSEAFLALFFFALLVLGLAAMGSMQYTGKTTQWQTSYNPFYDSNHDIRSQGASMPVTGLMTGQDTAFTAMWVLALVVLVPLELHIRKK